MNAVTYLLNRLKEPGTLRSLAVVVFALKGVVPDDGMLDGFVTMAILALGMISAVMPEQVTKAVAKVQDAATDVQTAAADVKAAANSAADTAIAVATKVTRLG